MTAIETKTEKPSFPRLRYHKATRRWFVVLDGRTRYWPTGTSKHVAEADYAAMRDAAESGAAVEFHATKQPEAPTIDTLIDAWLRHCDSYYRSSPGSIANAEAAVRPLHELFGRTLAGSFGPKMLRELRDRMIARGWSRPTINKRVETIRGMFQWAVAEELVPVAVFESLRCVTGLRKGRSDAPEPQPTLPVAWEHVEPVLPHLPPTLRAAVEFAWWTGARTGEIVRMTPAEIDRSRSPWIYAPATWKGSWRGADRTVPIGPRAQEAIRPLLDRLPAPDPALPLFSPVRALAELGVERRSVRRSRVSPSQARRDCTRKQRQDRKRAPGAGYTPITFAQAIRSGIVRANGALMRDAIIIGVSRAVPENARAALARKLATLPACVVDLVTDDPAKRQRAESILGRALERAARYISGLKSVGVRVAGAELLQPARDAARAAAPRLIPFWRPYALRHAAATRIRREAGLEEARVVLGHASLAMAEHYARIDRAKAIDVAARLG